MRIIEPNRCQNCHEFLNPGKIERSLLSGYKPVKCENCESVHHVTTISRICYALSVAAPIILSRMFGPVGFAIGVCVLLLLYYLSPYFLRYERR